MSRYFDESTVTTKNCRRCGGEGHTASGCTKDALELSRCLLCAEIGHLVSNCPQKSTHRSVVRAYINQDHSEDGAICIVCRDPDHVNCTFLVDEDKLPKTTCPKCGGKGHDETKCPDLNRGRSSWPPADAAQVYPARPTARHSHGSGGGRSSSSSNRWNQWEEDTFFKNKKRPTGAANGRPNAKRQRIW